MKTSVKKITSALYKKLSVLMATLIFSLYSVAQETKSVDVNISSDGDGGGFFTQPWVWIVGGAVFLLLLVALLRGNSARD